jgi:hypothetical protein
MNKVGVLLAKHWKELLILAFIVIFALFFYQSGKAKGDQKGLFDWLSGFQGGDDSNKDPRVIELPDDGSCPDGWDPAPLSERLYDEMKGWNWSYDDDLYREFATLPTDCMVAAVNNHFNATYGGGQSLRQWMEDEGDYLGDGKELAIQRLVLINA